MAGNSPGRAPLKNARSQRLKTLLNVALVLTDITMLLVAFIVGYFVREGVQFVSNPAVSAPLFAYWPTIALQVLTIGAMFYFSRMYHQPRAISRIDMARSVSVLVTIGSLMVMSLQEIFFKNTLFDPVDYPRSLFFYVLVFSIIMVVLGRILHRMVVTALRIRGLERDNLLIVGTTRHARDLLRKIKGSPELGYEIIGMVHVSNNNSESTRTSISGVPVLGTSENLPDIIDEFAVKQVIIAVPDSNRAEALEIIGLCQRGQVDIKIYPDMFAYIAGDMTMGELGDMPLITVRDISLRGWKLSLKRGLDLVGSLVGIVLLSPLLLLTAILVRLESPGNVFYTQERMGLDGKPFQMIKFRSMRQDAEAKGVGWTVKDDPRVTRIGRIMRKTNWDELPQLINVLLGEMSLVGPRPERPVYVNQFRSQIPRYMERHREKAGMTGWAQVNGLRGDTSINDRTSYDLWYVENWSLWLDIKIIIRTVLNIITRKDENAY